MRCSVIPFSSKLRGTSISEIFLGSFSEYLRSLLLNSTADERWLSSRNENLLELNEIGVYDSVFQSIPPKNQECVWEVYFRHLFVSWHQLHCNSSSSTPSGSDTFSKPDVISVILNFCGMVVRNQTSFLSLPQNVSLFLSITTEEQGLEFKEGLGDIWNILAQIKSRYSNFWDWIEAWRLKYALLNREQDFGTRVAFRYFIFEFLRRYPEASEELSRKYEWGAEYPAMNIWEIWTKNWIHNHSQNDPKEDLQKLLALKMNINFISWEEFRPQNNFGLEGIDLCHLFNSWHQLSTVSSGIKSEQETLLIIRNFYSTLFERKTKDFDSTEALSLFLAVLTEPQLEPDQQHCADSGVQQIFRTMKKIQYQFPKFLKSLDNWTTECLTSNHLSDNYGTIIGTRYFIFEVLRRYPNASKYFHQEFGWESENPIHDLWKLWQESFSTKGMMKKCKEALRIWRLESTKAVASQRRISVNLLKLFCASLRMTPLKCWKPGTMKMWEKILFKDKASFDTELISPEFIQRALEVSQKWNVLYRAANPISPPSKLWPLVLAGCRSKTQDSDEWIWMLAAASLGWSKVTGDSVMENVARDHLGFWNFVSRVDMIVKRKPFLKKSQSMFPVGSSVTERIMRRYLVLRLLSEDRRLKDFGFVWSDVSESMWKYTQSAGSQPACRKMVDSTVLVSQEQFCRLLAKALNLIKIGAGEFHLKEEDLKDVMCDFLIQALIELEAGEDWMEA